METKSQRRGENQIEWSGSKWKQNHREEERIENRWEETDEKSVKSGVNLERNSKIKLAKWHIYPLRLFLLSKSKFESQPQDYKICVVQIWL